MVHIVTVCAGTLTVPVYAGTLTVPVYADTPSHSVCWYTFTSIYRFSLFD